MYKRQDIVYTEFVSANGIIRENQKTLDMMKFSNKERPIGIQIFGDSVEVLGDSAALISERFAPDIIDINFGCPAPKVCRNDAGAALLRDPDKVVNMVRRCISSTDVPISVKMRLGTGSGENTALEISQRLAEEGVLRICVHGRTLRQRYSGTADWNQIKEISDSVDIPVIANGDVIDTYSAKACLQATGASGLMIGRGAIGRPTVFHEIKEGMGWSVGNPPWGEGSPSKARRWCWDRYLELSEEVFDESGGKNLKRHAVSFTKGLPGASAMRVRQHSKQHN